MRIKLSLLVPFLIYVIPILSQNANSRVVYHADHKLSSNLYNGQNTLHFNKNKSLFVHNGFPTKSTTNEDGNTTVITLSDNEGSPQFTDLVNSTTYTKVLNGLKNQNVILKERLKIIDWKIKDEQRIIQSYNCIKAIGEFEGRNYVVWFTLDIPVSFGPYRLNGLPGLILEAKSLDGKINWKFVGYEENSTDVKPLKPSTDGLLMGWDEFLEASLNIKRQIESKSTSEYTVTISNTNGEYNIEKDKFNIWN